MDLPIVLLYEAINRGEGQLAPWPACAFIQTEGPICEVLKCDEGHSYAYTCESCRYGAFNSGLSDKGAHANEHNTSKTVVTQMTYKEPPVTSGNRVEKSLRQYHCTVQEAQASSATRCCEEQDAQDLGQDEVTSGSLADPGR